MTQATFEIAASGDDSDVYRASVGSSYPPTGATSSFPSDTLVQVAKYWSSTDLVYYVVVGLLRWDTSSIPDGATITGATLRLYIPSRGDTDTRNITFGWYSWTPPAVAGDWVEPADTSAHAGTSIIALTGAADNDFALLSPATNINKTGYTGLRGTISGGVPSQTGQNIVNIASWDDATLTAPRLIVDYTFQTTRLSPDAILAQSNLTGAVSTIQDDPDSPDANWLTAP